MDILLLDPFNFLTTLFSVLLCFVVWFNEISSITNRFPSMKLIFAVVSLCLLVQSASAQTSSSFSQRRSIKARQASALNSAPSALPELAPLSDAPTIRGTYISSLSESQQQSLNSLVSQSSKLLASYESSSRSVVSIEGTRLSEAFLLRSPEDVQSATMNFLSVVGPLIGLRDVHSELKIDRTERDAQGRVHVRMTQHFDGIKMWGTEAIVHFNAKGEVESYNGRLQPTLSLTPGSFQIAASATQSAAITVCLKDLTQTHTNVKLSEQAQELLGYKEPSVEQVLLPSRSTASGNPRNCWHFSIRPNLIERWEYFVDCATSELVFKFNNTCADGPATANATDLNNSNATINSYLHKSAYYLIDATRPMFQLSRSTFPNATVGSIWTIDARSTDLSDFFNVNSSNNTWSDRASVSAHANSALTYEYFRQTHGRSAIDGSGGTIISVIHVTEGGRAMDNAYWNGKLMAYGDGASAFKSLAGAVDVAAHEMTHGVTENTCALEYLSQSGAINESMSDVFGCFVERNNWKIGEDVVRTTAFPSGALRDMANPHNGGNSINDNGWQPAHMNEYQKLPETQEGDNGGVHVNSGIPNRAAFLIQQAIGMNKAEKVYYDALRLYLTKNSQFIDLRRAIIKAAQNLFSSVEVNACAAAFDAVGILDGNATNTNKDQEAVNGTEWILLHNTDFNADPNSLYIVKPESPQSSDFHPITRTKLNRRPSVVDNGSFAVFVAQDNRLHAINLDINNPQESILNSIATWENVAISRDGKRLAAISIEIDSSIYVYDLSTSPTRMQRYKLYAPTTAQGIRNYNIEYADAIEWDFSGKNVLFDAFTRIANGQGDTVEYWNIGILRAYDPASNSFADGTIFSVLPPLANGVSVGNPTYSKNSPNVIALDVINDNTNTYFVYALNTESGDANVLVNDNGALGYPSYGRLDNKLAFASISGGKSIVNILPLSADRISSTGAGVFLASDAEFPVFYTVGSRPVSVSDNQDLNTMLRAEPNPAQDALTLHFQASTANEASVRISDILGTTRRHVPLTVQECAVGSITLDTRSLENGVYHIQLNSSLQQRSILIVIAR